MQGETNQMPERSEGLVESPIARVSRMLWDTETAGGVTYDEACERWERGGYSFTEILHEMGQAQRKPTHQEMRTQFGDHLYARHVFRTNCLNEALDEGAITTEEYTSLLKETYRVSANTAKAIGISAMLGLHGNDLSRYERARWKFRAFVNLLH